MLISSEPHSEQLFTCKLISFEISTECLRRYWTHLSGTKQPTILFKPSVLQEMLTLQNYPYLDNYVLWKTIWVNAIMKFLHLDRYKKTSFLKTWKQQTKTWNKKPLILNFLVCQKFSRQSWPPPLHPWFQSLFFCIFFPTPIANGWTNNL